MTAAAGPIRTAMEFAESAGLDWAPHEDGSISIFHPNGAARVSPDGQVLSLPNPRLKAALERKIAEAELKEDHKMDNAEEIFEHISRDLLPQLSDRQLTNLIELIRAALAERETERILAEAA